ncbi:MAG TPA: hypothetical protein VHQ86_03315, partial [Candidatus Saccharimonadia bacterium]|nr:hypothetical protein [Candidatus Saccharimonadia bacterium]
MSKAKPLGISRDHENVALIGVTGVLRKQLALGHGHGKSIAIRQDPPVIVLPMGRKEDGGQVRSPRLSNVLRDSILTYSIESKTGPQHLRVAVHKHDEDLNVWEVPALNHQLFGSGMVVSEYKHEGQYVLYHGDRHITASFSRNLVAWHSPGQHLLSPRAGHYDKHALKVISADYLEQGLLVLYESTNTTRAHRTISIGAALFAKDNPTHLIWRSDEALWEDTSAPRQEKTVIGAVVYAEEIVLYLTSKRESLITVSLPNPYAQRPIGVRKTQLHRFPQNPVLSPTMLEWESEAVFNPGAFVADGRVHLLYRAMGPDGVSRIGYASSPDGVHFDERLDYPVFQPALGFGAPTPDRAGTVAQHYDPEAHPSGGGWAGCEDPRVVTIDGRVYMTFMAFNGWEFMRIALTSIHLDDLNNKNWSWKRPVLISQPGEPAKNWMLFPEKINGKYAVLHGVSPKIHVDYIDDLDELNGKKFIKSLTSHGGHGYQDHARKHNWDNRMRGAGAPPIRTAMGWLLLYHATDTRDPGKYKLG